MARRGRAFRGGILALVVLVFAWAIAILGPRPETPPPAEPRPAVTSVPAAAPANWSVRVDGWVIQVDGVIGRRPAEALEAEAEPAPGTVLDAALSPYDDLVGRYADQAGFDWRLVAALIFEESRFDEDALSPAGAYGLMQVRPIAAVDVGQVEFRDAESNIRTGVLYLKRLEALFDQARGRDRTALMLAAYNMGPAHLQDAQFLARRFGYDPWAWSESMQAVLPLLEEQRFYEHLPSGYAQGSHTAAYVERVLARFDAYRRTLSAEPPGVLTTARR